MGGAVYVATKRGLFRADRNGRRAELVRIEGREVRASTWALLADGDDLWIGGQYDGLWRMDLRTRTGHAGPAQLQAPGLSSPQVTMLAGGGRDGLWVGTRNGLNRVDTATGGVTQVPTTAVVGGYVSALLTDGRGRRWVGTYGRGIDVLPAEGSPDQPVHLGVSKGLPATTVNALVLDAHGDVWVSLDGSLARIDASNLSVQSLGRSDNVLLPTYWTNSAARGAGGEVMFGGAGGITVVRPERLVPPSYPPQVLVSEVRVGGRTSAGADTSATWIVPADANSLAVEFSSSAFATPGSNRYAYKLDGVDADWRNTDATRRVAAYSNLAPGDYVLRLRAAQADGAWSAHEVAQVLRVLPAWYQTWWFRVVQGLALVLIFLAAVALRTRWLRGRQQVLEGRVRERTAELEAAHRALEEKSLLLELSSMTDPLTGLNNRRYVTERIERDLAAGQRRAKEARAVGAELTDADWAFLLVDIDRFKQVNDGFGHSAGDAVLVELGQRLRAVLRESDDLVRWGGEEFLAIARETDRHRVEELAAERMRESVARTAFRLPDGQFLPVTCSIGFASLALGAENAKPAQWPQVVDRADRGLYAAKRSGRDAWVGIYTDPETDSASLATGDGHWVISNRPLEAVIAAYAGASEVHALSETSR